MPFLLAESAQITLNLTTLQIGIWVGCAAFVLMIIRNAIAIKADMARMRQGTPGQPVHLAHPVKMEHEKEYAEKEETKHSIRALEAKDQSLELHITQELSAFKLAAEKRATDIKEAIGEKIEGLMKEVHHRLNNQDKDIARIEQQQKAHDDELRAWRT